MKQICHFERSVAMTANIALLMIGLSVSGQTLQLELARNIHRSTSYAVMAGASGYNDDSIVGGISIKQYPNGGNRIALKANANLTVSPNVFIGIQTEVFPIQSKGIASFVEGAIGTGLNYRRFQLSLNYVPFEFNPVDKVSYEDGVMVKFGYRVKFER